MKQTTCQNCKASNKANAVVCFNCGVKLAHDERRIVNQLKNSGFFDRLASAPQRLATWLYKKIKMVVTLLVLLVTLGTLMALILCFMPFGWPKYTAIPLHEDDAKELRNQIVSLYSKEAEKSPQTLELNLNSAVVIADSLLYATEPVGPAIPLVTDPGEEKTFVVAVPNKDDRTIFTVTGKLYDKLPWRLAVEVEAVRKDKGALRIFSFKYGNMRVSRSIFFKLLERHLRAVNPNEQLSSLLRRIDAGLMENHQLPKRDFSVTFGPIGTAAKK